MANRNVIIIHGAYGYPEENWFGWLKRELQDLNMDCHVPHFPTPEGQHLDRWLEIFDRDFQSLIHGNTILIGHSLGAAFILRWLETHPCSLASVILVGAFFGSVGNEKFDHINESFFRTPFDWTTIRERAQSFVSYYGTEDPYVTQETFDTIAHALQAKKMVIANAKHFNTASGYHQFPQLLDHLKQYS